MNGGSGAGGAFINGHRSRRRRHRHVVLAGSIRQTAAANYGWIATAATGCTATGNPVNANNNIDVTTPVGHSVPYPEPVRRVLVGLEPARRGRRRLDPGPARHLHLREDLALRATYGGASAGTSRRTRRPALGRRASAPGPGRVTFPRSTSTSTSRAAPTVDANLATHGYAVSRTLVNPTRTGYVFDGWTGSGIEGASRNVTLPRYPSAALAYTATWTPVAYAVSYEPRRREAAGANPASYTVESAAFTLANPTRTGYAFAGWTGTGVDQPTATVTVAAGSTGSRSYTARLDADRLPADLRPRRRRGGRGEPGVVHGRECGVHAGEPDPHRTCVRRLDRHRPDGADHHGRRRGGSVAGALLHRHVDADRLPRSSTTSATTWTSPARCPAPTRSSRRSSPCPRRCGPLVFAGWAGTGLTGPAQVVTIPRGSSGTRTYTPTWDRVPPSPTGSPGVPSPGAT